jgi:hypothetical protein
MKGANDVSKKRCSARLGKKHRKRTLSLCLQERLLAAEGNDFLENPYIKVQ